MCSSQLSSLRSGNRRRRYGGASARVAECRAGLSCPCASHLIIVASDDQPMWKIISSVVFPFQRQRLGEPQPITREQLASHGALLRGDCGIFGDTTLFFFTLTVAITLVTKQVARGRSCTHLGQRTNLGLSICELLLQQLLLLLHAA